MAGTSASSNPSCKQGAIALRSKESVPHACHHAQNYGHQRNVPGGSTRVGLSLTFGSPKPCIPTFAPAPAKAFKTARPMPETPDNGMCVSCAFVCIRASAHASACVREGCVYVCVCLFVCVRACMHAYSCVCVCVCVCMCDFVCVSACVCECIQKLVIH